MFVKHHALQNPCIVNSKHNTQNIKKKQTNVMSIVNKEHGAKVSNMNECEREGIGAPYKKKEPKQKAQTA